MKQIFTLENRVALVTGAAQGIGNAIATKLADGGMKVAIVGDFSRYTSKPLQDFIRESNRGKTVFFVSSESEALEKLAAL